MFASASLSRILVVKHGAFGNIVLAMPAFAAIRRHHPGAEITLLTTAPFAGWLAKAPYFDRVLVDPRPGWWDLPAVVRLARMLRRGAYQRVYDVQTSGRSSRYFRLFPRHRRPEWSGIAGGCSHPDRDPGRDHLHDFERLGGQLRQAGIPEMPPADLSWCRGDLSRFALPPRCAILVPGSSAHRPQKRWPAEHYRLLGEALMQQGVTPVVVGGKGEQDLAAIICRDTGAIDLTGRTGFGELAELGRAAVLAVGNDTGPMHLLAAVGCPSVVLFSAESDPARCAPRGGAVHVLRRPDLAGLPVEAVVAEAVVAALPGEVVG